MKNSLLDPSEPRSGSLLGSMCFPQTHVGGSQEGVSTPSAPRRIYSHKQAIRERGMTTHSTALNRSVVGWRFYKCNWIEILIPRNREAHNAWKRRYFCSSIWFQILCLQQKARGTALMGPEGDKWNVLQKTKAGLFWGQKCLNYHALRTIKPWQQ